MTTAQSYAKAMHALVTEHPEKGTEYIANLRTSLAQRGYEKLLPVIISEYQKLAEHEQRAAAYAAPTPEKERTRVLYELYKKLTHDASQA